MDIRKNFSTTDPDTRLVLGTASGSGSGDNTSRRNADLCVPSTSMPVIEDGIRSEIPFYTHADSTLLRTGCGSGSRDNTIIWNEISSTSTSQLDRGKGKIRQMEKKQFSTQKNISLGTLRTHFSESIKDAAKNLGVCPTTLKRICRQHGITRWPSRQIRKVKRSFDKMQEVVQSGKGFGAGLNLQSITGGHVEASTIFQDRKTAAPINSELAFSDLRPSPPTPHGHPEYPILQMGRNQLVADMPNSITPNGTPLEDIPRSWAEKCNGFPAKHLLSMSNRSPGMHNFLCMDGSDNHITVKAMYNEETVRFKFHPSSGCSQLFEEIGKLFNLQNKTFQLKYIDDENELVLLRSDADLKECLEVFASLGSSSIKVVVSDISYIELKFF